jgi:hypothetical protein
MFISVAVVFATMVLTSEDLSPRQFSSMLSAVCFGGMLYRCVPYWPMMTSLERALAVLMTAYLLIAAVGSYQLDKVNAPVTNAIWWSMGLKCLILVVILFWPWLHGRADTLKKRVLHQDSA